MAKDLGSRKIKRASNNPQATKDGETLTISKEEEEREYEGGAMPLSSTDNLYPSSNQRPAALNFEKITQCNQQPYEEPPASNENYFRKQVPVQQAVQIPTQQYQQQQQYSINKQPTVTNTSGCLFSSCAVEYEYNKELITEATEVSSISDNDFLLDYVYRKEKEVGATLLVEAYGVSDNIFETSTTHEIITLGSERYFSNKQETLNKERLDTLMADIAKALSTVGYYDLPLIKKHTFSNKEGNTNCIKAMSINTYEFNAIMGLEDRFSNLSSSTFEKENNIFMRFQKS